MRLGFSLVLLSATASLAACEGSRASQLSPCQVYRPHLAKKTFDGRVGAVLFHNASPRQVDVNVYHPDGIGDVELRRRVAAGVILVLQDGNGARLTLGNDWGFQVEQSCVTTLGQSASWAPGEFSLHWDGTNLAPGLSVQ